MQLKTYLHFDGNCNAALDFYCEVFGTSVGRIVTYGDAPPGSFGELPDGYASKVLHSELIIAGMSVMMSDGFPGWQANFGNSMGLVLNTESADAARIFYEKLCVGGTVLMPFAKTFFSEGYGMCTDKFGVLWHVGVQG